MVLNIKGYFFVHRHPLVTHRIMIVNIYICCDGVNKTFFHSCFRSAYPLGLPEEFTFVAVLRMGGSTINKNWNIWQMQSAIGEEQLAVRLNGETKSLEFTFMVLNAGKQTIIFSQIDSLFDDLWHSILLEVSRHSVTLFVDCHMIQSEKTPARQKVSLDGFTLIGKSKDNPLTAIPV